MDPLPGPTSGNLNTYKAKETVNRNAYFGVWPVL